MFNHFMVFGRADTQKPDVYNWVRSRNGCSDFTSDLRQKQPQNCDPPTLTIPPILSPPEGGHLRLPVFLKSSAGPLVQVRASASTWFYLAENGRMLNLRGQTARHYMVSAPSLPGCGASIHLPFAFFYHLLHPRILGFARLLGTDLAGCRGQLEVDGLSGLDARDRF